MEDRLKNHQAELIRFYRLVEMAKYPIHPSTTGITFITDDGLETFSYELLCEFFTVGTFQNVAENLEFRLRQKGVFLSALADK